MTRDHSARARSRGNRSLKRKPVQFPVPEIIRLSCEAWAIAKSPEKQQRDEIRYGHARHSCSRYIQQGVVHDGSHECRCGISW